MRPTIALAVFLLGFTASGEVRGPGAPEWTTGSLPDGMFLGTSSDQETEDLARHAAIASAMLEIAHSLGVYVEAEILERSVLVAKQGREDFTEAIDQRVRAVSRVLVRVRTDRYETRKDCDPGGRCRWSAWALVAFSKRDHSDYMNGLADEVSAAMKTSEERSARLAEGGDLDGAARALADTMNAGKQFDGLFGVPPEVSARLRESRDRLRDAVESLFVGLRIEADAARVEGLRRELIAQAVGFKVTRPDGRPAVGLTLSLRSVEGEVQFSGAPRTGNDGRGSAKIQSFKGHAPRYVVEARPGVPSFSALGVTIPASGRVEIVARPGTISLSVDAGKNGRDIQGIWSKGLGTALERRGFQLVRGQAQADYRVSVEIRVRDESSDGLHQATVEASVRLEDKTRANLWSWQFPDSRFRSAPVSAPSFEEASERAARSAMTTLLLEWIAASVEQRT